MPEQQRQLDWPAGYERTAPDDREPYPSDENYDVIVAGSGSTTMDDDTAADLLGISPDSPGRVVETAFQERLKSGHPDQGGDGGVQRLQKARDRILDSSC